MEFQSKTPCLLLCATKPEALPFLKAFSLKPAFHKSFPLYENSSRNLRLIQLGIGPSAIEKKREALLSYLSENPQGLVVHFGVSGALKEGMKVGDLILCDLFLSHEGSLSPQDGAFESLHQNLQENKIRFLKGGLFSSPVVLSSVESKTQAGLQKGAVAVDMETYWVAKICAELELPYLSLRAIFDPLAWDLEDLSASAMMKESGEVSAAGSLKALVKRPKLLMSLPRFQRALKIANDEILKALSSFLGSHF